MQLTKTLFGAILLATVQADDEATSACPSSIRPSYAAPSVAAGYTARIVAKGLSKPRGLMFDKNGHLLVIQQSYGLTSLTLKDNGGACVSVVSKKDVIKDSGLNHGLEMSPDGNTIYASTTNDLFSWSYDASQQANTSRARTLVTAMQGSDHSTRTLTLSRKVPGMMLISRGSFSNLDYDANFIESGHSQIRAFNLNNVSSVPYAYSEEGLRIAWGVRNSVGVAEHPMSGGIYSVENSADNVQRLGQDVHQDNPGEEMNFHGYLNGTAYAGQGQNYGYPNCYSAWKPASLPNNGALQVGTPFAIGTPNATVNDTNCQQHTIPARLTFPAHWAPLDIKFTSDGTMAWITSHGSWNRDRPDGYKLFQVAFNANGEPTQPANSSTAVVPILSNANNSACPNGCFRPAGLAWDSKGRLYMSSDSTGEIYVITKNNGGGVDQALASTSTLGSSGSASPIASAGHGGSLKFRSMQTEALCAAFGIGCLLV